MKRSRAWDSDAKHLIKIPKEELKKRGFKFLGSGRHRVTYQFPSGKYVIKFPYNDAGVLANHEEVCRYLHSEEEIYARCRIFKINDATCVVMEYVNQVSVSCVDVEENDWMKSIDSFQVGVNSKGNYVAYDFSDWEL